MIVDKIMESNGILSVLWITNFEKKPSLGFLSWYLWKLRKFYPSLIHCGFVR